MHNVGQEVALRTLRHVATFASYILNRTTTVLSECTSGRIDTRMPTRISDAIGGMIDTVQIQAWKRAATAVNQRVDALTSKPHTWQFDGDCEIAHCPERIVNFVQPRTSSCWTGQ